ncbi:MAG: DNA-3-methyladenine glycosylase, partial [Chloroflexota bacterium]|nr:DNA-3-methyladenine glycosylase [Chloroflexota bacterium]
MARTADRSFFARHASLVAPELIGWRLAPVGDVPGRPFTIVETEAYGDETDLASHTAVYRKARRDTMRRTPGFIYVYLSYGVHLCLNFHAHEEESAGAVLIRALEPDPGKNLPARLAAGPGLATRALGATREWDGLDLLQGEVLRLLEPISERSVATSPRIGITRDVDRLWR